MLNGRDDILARFAGYLHAREEGDGAEYLVLSGYRGWGRPCSFTPFATRLGSEAGWPGGWKRPTRAPSWSLASEVTDLLEGFEAQAGMLRRARQAVEELSVALGAGPAARLGVRFSAGALDHLVAASEGYPYLVQLLDRNAWEAAGGAELITLEHARTAEGGARADLTNSLLRSRWLRASPKEREYLAAMASLGSRPVASGAVARALGQTAQQLSSVR